MDKITWQELMSILDLEFKHRRDVMALLLEQEKETSKLVAQIARETFRLEFETEDQDE